MFRAGTRPACSAQPRVLATRRHAAEKRGRHAWRQQQRGGEGPAADAVDASGALLLGARQLAFDFTDAERDQRDQFEQDKRHMQERLARIDAEFEPEPPQITELCRVVLPRLEQVGLVVLWPAVRG